MVAWGPVLPDLPQFINRGQIPPPSPTADLPPPPSSFSCQQLSLNRSVLGVHIVSICHPRSPCQSQGRCLSVGLLSSFLPSFFSFVLSELGLGLIKQCSTEKNIYIFMVKEFMYINFFIVGNKLIQLIYKLQFNTLLTSLLAIHTLIKSCHAMTQYINCCCIELQYLLFFHFQF